jgi:hypothetical protein
VRKQVSWVAAIDQLPKLSSSLRWGQRSNRKQFPYQLIISRQRLVEEERFFVQGTYGTFLSLQSRKDHRLPKQLSIRKSSHMWPYQPALVFRGSVRVVQLLSLITD